MASLQSRMSNKCTAPLLHRATIGVASVLCCAAFITAAEPPGLRDGDRVALIGDALIERDGEFAFLETALACTVPGGKVRFRNFGWTGDTVAGSARHDGLKGLNADLTAFAPTVVVLGYGTTDSFAGAAKVAAFSSGLTQLIATVGSGRRLVIVAPVAHQQRAGMPDAAVRNADLLPYVEALASAAKPAGLFVDWFRDLAGPVAAAEPLSDNGIHLNQHGYRLAAQRLARALDPTPAWRIELTAPATAGRVSGATVSDLAAAGGGVQWTALDRTLPLAGERRVVQVTGLAAGRYALAIDGTAVASGDARQWAAGVEISSGPDYAQAERLRQVILRKNDLWFCAWRPRNQMYLSGGRKREQGRHVAELAALLPLAAEQETAIVPLTKPSPRAYRLSPAAAGATP